MNNLGEPWPSQKSMRVWYVIQYYSRRKITLTRPTLDFVILWITCTGLNEGQSHFIRRMSHCCSKLWILEHIQEEECMWIPESIKIRLHFFIICSITRPQSMMTAKPNTKTWIRHHPLITSSQERTNTLHFVAMKKNTEGAHIWKALTWHILHTQDVSSIKDNWGNLQKPRHQNTDFAPDLSQSVKS